MNRWGVFNKRVIHIDGNVHLIRYKLINTPFGGIYIHRFMRPDMDRHMHDHPWNFATFILNGSYTELFDPLPNLYGMSPGPTYKRYWRKLSFHRMHTNQAHMVTKISNYTPLITLVFVGPKKDDWGFYTLNGWVQWEKYDRIAKSWREGLTDEAQN